MGKIKVSRNNLIVTFGILFTLNANLLFLGLSLAPGVFGLDSQKSSDLLSSPSPAPSLLESDVKPWSESLS